MNRREATVKSLRLLADAIEAEEVEYVRSDVLMSQQKPGPHLTGYYDSRRISLFVEVKT